MYFHSLTLRLIHKRKILLLCISSILKKECYIVFSYKILVILISTIFLLIGGCGLLSTTRTNNDNFSEKKNEKDKPVQNALNSNNKQNKFLESLQMLSGPVQNSVDDPSAYMKGKVTTGSGTKLRNLKIIYDKKSNQVNGFSLINKSSPRINPNSIGGTPSREYVFEFYDRARQQILLRISDDTIRGGKITHSLMHSNFYFFPRKYLPFHVPVNIDVTGETAQIAAGLVHGQVNDLLSAISLKRQAKASIDVRYAKEVGKLEQLDWNDLTYDEQQLCPPLLLVGGDDLLGGQGFSQVSQLLNSSYPIKIVVFTELDSGLVYGGLNECKLNSHIDSRNNLAMMAVSQRNAYVAQTSIANNNHLQLCVHDLLYSSTPGLLSIHTPSPARHGFSPQYCLRQAQLAVSSRMFPLFTYNPQQPGVFGSRISIESNESNMTNWIEIKDNKALTPVDWALHDSLTLYEHQLIVALPYVQTGYLVALMILCSQTAY